MAWPCEPRERHGESEGQQPLTWLRQEEEDETSRAQPPYLSAPASAGLFSSAVLSFPSLQRFIFVSSVICNEPL